MAAAIPLSAKQSSHTHSSSRCRRRPRRARQPLRRQGGHERRVRVRGAMARILAGAGRATARRQPGRPSQRPPITRKPLAVACRPDGRSPSPRASASQRWRESRAEVLRDDEVGRRRPGRAGAARCSSSSWSAGLADPDRRVGPDEVEARRRRVCRPAVAARTRRSPRAAALRGGEVERALVDVDGIHRRRRGSAAPRVRATGPQPQPRSRKVPAAGGAGASREQDGGALVEPAGGEDAAGDLGPRRSRPARGTRRRPRGSRALAGCGGEVVVGRSLTRRQSR